MKRPRTGLALLLGGGASFVAFSYLASRSLSKRLISAEGLGPTDSRREDLLDALEASGAKVADFRHPGSPATRCSWPPIFASPGTPEQRPTILFLHGKGGNSAEWQPDALRALSLGYNVLVPDLRAHAPSGGTFVTYGFLEKEDLSRAVDAARERFGLDAGRLGVHGCSAGSTVALEFAAGRSDVRAVWLESPYADPQEMARHYLAVATGLPPWYSTSRRAGRSIARHAGSAGSSDCPAARATRIASIPRARSPASAGPSVSSTASRTSWFPRASPRGSSRACRPAAPCGARRKPATATTTTRRRR